MLVLLWSFLFQVSQPFCVEVDGFPPESFSRLLFLLLLRGAALLRSVPAMLHSQTSLVAVLAPPRRALDDLGAAKINVGGAS